MELKGTTALVTGGASGLGEACVRRFVRAGANVAILDLDAERGENLATELGANAYFLKTDVSNEASVKAAIQATIEAFGELRIVVNCAGIAIARRVVSKEGPHPLHDFEKVIRVNLTGTFNVIRLAAVAIIEHASRLDDERGVIINTASVAAFDGQIGQAAYSAAKGGVAAMTLPIARELARFGIRVVTIAPGLFDTPMLAALPEPVRQALSEQTPFPQRLGKPEEFAHLVQAIVENEMLNGEVIRLDGALRMPPR